MTSSAAAASSRSGGERASLQKTRRQGFYLVTVTGDEWIPKRALQAPFRPGDLATLLRGEVRSYRVEASRAARSRDLPA